MARDGRLSGIVVKTGQSESVGGVGHVDKESDRQIRDEAGEEGSWDADADA